MAKVVKRRGKWVVDHRDLLGVRRTPSFNTRKDAERKLAKILDQKDKGTYNPAAAKLKVRDYSAEWLVAYSRLNALKESTIKSYRQCLTLYILPALGPLPLQAVQRETVKGLITELLGRGLSRNTVRIVLATLRAMFNSAADEQKIFSNPAVRTGKFIRSKPGVQKKANPFSKQELIIFLNVINTRFGAYFPFFLTLARTGNALG